MIVKSKLIFMEGLPSTGKSTNSSILLSQLNRNRKNARWIHEVSRPHPTLFFDEARLDNQEYRLLLDKYPKYKLLLDQLKTKRNQSIVFDLLDLEWNYSHLLNREVIDDIRQYDVWNFSIDKYVDVALEKWNDFVEELRPKDEIIILDSSIFQFQIYTLILAGESFQRLKSFIDTIYEIVSPLNPSLVYLYRENTDDTINYLIRDRGISFLERIWERDKEQPYYLNRPTGSAGYSLFLKDYAKYAKSLFDAFPFPKLLLEISKGRWGEYVEQLMNFFNLNYIESPKVQFPNGSYYNEHLKETLVISNEKCLAPGGGEKRLFAKSDTEFYFYDIPVILRVLNDCIVIEGEQLCERWTTTGTVFKRVE
jgi:hypothetical protein